MIVFGLALGLESFSKDMKVGTYVIIIGATLLPEVGPQVQANQDIMDLIGKPYSLVWLGLLIFTMTFMGALMGFLEMKALSQSRRIGLILCARASSFTVNLTVSRVMALRPNVAYLAISIVLKILSLRGPVGIGGLSSLLVSTVIIAVIICPYFFLFIRGD